MKTLTKLEFNTSINAPKEKVWEILWNDNTYREWTNVFSEGSYAESDWKEGSKILFLAPDGNGMSSIIEKMLPHEEMVFKHMGMVENGVEQPSNEQTKEWEGARESYYLQENNGITGLKVKMETTEEFEQYFRDTFPKALEVVKKLAENH